VERSWSHLILRAIWFGSREWSHLRIRNIPLKFKIIWLQKKCLDVMEWSRSVLSRFPLWLEASAVLLMDESLGVSERRSGACSVVQPSSDVLVGRARRAAWWSSAACWWGVAGCMTCFQGMAERRDVRVRWAAWRGRAGCGERQHGGMA
jgi:hypothetical protein